MLQRMLMMLLMASRKRLSMITSIHKYSNLASSGSFAYGRIGRSKHSLVAEFAFFLCFAIAGVGGYSYLSEPLWWAGMITSKSRMREGHPVS
jgi:hypothetical protein